jgi:hypothetical protein
MAKGDREFRLQRQGGTRDEMRRNCLNNRPRATKSIGLNAWKAVCIERCTYSLVGGRWKRAAYAVPRQRPTQLTALGVSHAPASGEGRNATLASPPGPVQKPWLAQSTWTEAAPIRRMCWPPFAI